MIDVPPGIEDFDEYLDRHRVRPGEEPNALAAWLHESVGWEEPAEEAS